MKRTLFKRRTSVANRREREPEPRRAGAPLLALLMGVAVACEDTGGAVKLPLDASAGSVDAAEAGTEAGPAEVTGEVTPEVPAPTGMPFPLTILHTNDLHSHLQPHAPEADYTPGVQGDDPTIGGFARLATAIGMRKMAAMAAGKDVLLLDGGDFMMGTLFHLASTTAAAELELMYTVGYDAAALGNHEFDWTTRGLAGILNAAVTKQKIFPLLASNLRFNPTAPEDDLLEAFKDPGPLKTKLVKTFPSGLKVGFIGLIGPRAQQFATGAAPATFLDYKGPEIKALVTELRQTDKVDLVVALSHSGISADGQGEDRELAAANLGIDVIVSGHTHDKLEDAITVGRTLIVTAGSYGAYLGRLDLEVWKDGGVVTGVVKKGYELLPITDALPANAGVQGALDQVIAGLDMALMPTGFAYRKPIAESTFDLPNMDFQETSVGNLITDAYLTVSRALSPMEPPDLAVEANGSIRASLLKGKTGQIWFADMYRVLPLGIGPDGNPGYPLVSYYLHGKDIRSGLELAAAASSATLGKDDAFFLQFSGMQAEVKMDNLVFQRVLGASLVRGPGQAPVPIDLKDDKTCFKVVTTYYLAALFNFASSKLPPPLGIRAKEKDCVTPVMNLATRIIDRAPTTDGLQELKQWQAMASFVAQLPDSDGDMIPNVPASYGQPQGRLKLAK